MKLHFAMYKHELHQKAVNQNSSLMEVLRNQIY